MQPTTAATQPARLHDHAKLLSWRVEADLTREQVCVEVGVSFRGCLPWSAARAAPRAWLSSTGWPGSTATSRASC